MPSTEGWWRCCGCKREINPENFGTSCPDCQHQKCEKCTAVTPPPTPLQEVFNNVFETSQHLQHAVGDYGSFCPSHERFTKDPYFGSSRKPLQYGNTHLDDRSTDSQYATHGNFYPHSTIACSSGLPQLCTPMPPMAGYWKCCQCGGAVNFNVSGEVCPVDDHDRCSSCTVY